MTELNLDQLRAQIDDIDTQITDLFKQRMEISVEVAKYKKENGMAVLNSERELEILRRVSEQIGEPFDDYAKQLFNTIFEVSKACQMEII